MKNKNGVSFGLLSGIFWGLGLTISVYIFSIFTNLSPFVVAAAHDFLSIFILLAFLLIREGPSDPKRVHRDAALHRHHHRGRGAGRSCPPARRRRRPLREDPLT